MLSRSNTAGLLVLRGVETQACWLLKEPTDLAAFAAAKRNKNIGCDDPHGL
jgi:hypothetical protein